MIHREQELLRLIDEKWKLIYEELMNTKKELRDRGHHLNIALTIEEISQALEAAGSYVEFLYKFEKNFIHLLNTQSRINDHKDRIEELRKNWILLKASKIGKTIN